MLKKILAFTLAFMLVLSGCASEEENINWDRDLNEHWTLDENGEKTKIGEHVFDEYTFCTVCKSSVLRWDGGSAEIYNYYDEAQNYFSRITAYENGELIYDVVCDYEFDENGNPTYHVFHEGEKIIEEYFYAESTSVYYNEDGSYAKKIVNEAEGTSIYAEYDAEGNLIYEYHYASKNAEEMYLAKSINFDFEQGIKYVIEYRADGQVFNHKMYDLEGNLTSNIKYEYDEEGNPTYQANYEGDMLTIELYYKNLIDSDGNPFTMIIKEVIYKEDGGYFLCEFDDYGIVINEGEFDADGNKIR